MDVVREFDPWDGKYCTCPQKYSLNPYTGCGHRCIYCYATYIPNFFQPRRKKDLINRLEKDLEKLPKNSIISMSNSSDPYTPMDKEHEDTRECLQLLQNYEHRILIVTKSNLVTRDIDLLKNLESAVTITITTLKPQIHQKLEPNAPDPKERLKAVEKLQKEDISTGIRLDPIFPKLTEKEIPKIVRKAKDLGVEHVTTSTFKPRKDAWKRYKRSFSKTAEKTESQYFEKGNKQNNSYYLPKKQRLKLLRKVQKETKKHDLTFNTCREGINTLKTQKTCDGTHLTR